MSEKEISFSEVVKVLEKEFNIKNIVFCDVYGELFDLPICIIGEVIISEKSDE